MARAMARAVPRAGAPLVGTVSSVADYHHKIWRSVNVVKKLSDRVIGIGPFGLGIDGVLSWIPLVPVGAAYSIGAGGFLMLQGLRTGAKASTLARMAAYLAADVASSSVPFVKGVIDTLFPGHLMAAKALQKDIEDRHGAPPDVPMKERMRKTKPGQVRK